MPGTLVRDALAPNLLTGATLGAAGSTNGTEVQLDKPEDVTFVLDTGTVTGTNPTISVVIQGSDVSGFGSGVVTFGTIGITTGNAAAQSNVERQITTYVNKRYVRAVVTLGGTNPVYTGTTLTPRQKHDRRTATSTA
jgi:hypothetical protein